MRRNRPGPSSTTPYRAIAHHQAQAAAASTSPGSGATDPATLLRFFDGDSNPSRPIRPSPLTASTISDMPLDLVDRIRSFPLFLSAPEDFLVAIGSHLRPQIHSAQDNILTEGDDARAMYWLVRGVVAVTSRDGEAVYAELKPGAFFGEIGVLMNIPRTANVVARTKCLLVVLKKEDLQAELPKYPDMEKAIRQEAQERLTILKKKREESGPAPKVADAAGAKVAREAVPGEVSTGEVGIIREGNIMKSKKRKSPSPGAIEDPATGGSALGSGIVNVRKTLKELPLFSTLPADILHFLGLSAQPRTYTPFTDIIRQGTPGNEIFFIVRGEAEVIREEQLNGSESKRITRSTYTRPRLKQGQYFGEVASLGLSPGRTATVRSITTVECLIIGGKALDELWRRCPPEIKLQVEETARKRYQKPDLDVVMLDAPATAEVEGPVPERRRSLPVVTFTTPSKPSSPVKDDSDVRVPSDPDPYLSVDMENLRNRRRNSLAPTPTQMENPSPMSTARKPAESSPLKQSTPAPAAAAAAIEPDPRGPSKRPRIVPQHSHPLANLTLKPSLPDDILVSVFQHLSLLELLRLRQVHTHWRRLLATSPKLCKIVDLSPYNRLVNDWSVINVLAPFIGSRAVEIDINNCFHITDEGFQALWKLCGKNVKVWRMRSVWDVSASQILDMSDTAKGLEEVDWSNCRKVGDNLLARVVGWVVPQPATARDNKNVIISSSTAKSKPPPAKPSTIPPGTVIGCPGLSRLNLSYCKHITDRSMHHLAAHAASRLRALSLTRCTSITDAGFQAWAPYRFPRLTHLCLADCTYLTDHSVIALVNAAKSLTHLDLSFCCALSDTATEVVALGLPALKELRLAFCGSAVSDASLGCIALHLSDLQGLSVRGCVRVTGVGVENVLEGCSRLAWLDVSQCKNLGNWIVGGGVGRWGVDSRQDTTVVPLSPNAQATSSRGSAAGVFGFDDDSASAWKPKLSSVTAAGAGMQTKTAKSGRSAIAQAAGPGPMLRPVVPPRGINLRSLRARKPVRFVVEKGGPGLR
jgi:F-box and leucine-rich repeat protein 7